MSYEVPYPTGWGRVRVPGRCVWSNNSFVTDYWVRTPYMLWDRAEGTVIRAVYIIGEAPISAVHAIWRDGVRYEPGDFNRLCAVTDGSVELALTETPTAWTGLTGNAVGMAWQGLAQARFMNLALPDGKIPSLEFEVTFSRCVRGGDTDAHPTDVIKDLLCRPRVGWPGIALSQVEVDYGLDNTLASGASLYCTEAGWRVARAVTEPVSVAELFDSLLEAINCSSTESEGKIKVFPLEGRAVGTWSPPATAASIDEDELLEESRDIRCETARASEVYNRWPIQINSRESYYKPATYAVTVADHAAEYGERKAALRENAWIVTPAHAAKLSLLLGLRSVHNRNRYKGIRLGPRWSLPEPGDVIALTFSPLGLSNTKCRIKSFDGVGRGVREFVVEEWPDSLASPVDLTPQTHDGLDSVAAAPVYADGRADGDLGGGNLLRNSSFEVDSNADDLADYWTVYNGGPEAATVARGVGIYGGSCQGVHWASANTSTKGLSTSAAAGGGVAGGWVADRWYTVSIYASGSFTGGAPDHFIGFGWNNPPDDVEVVECPPLSGSWQRYVFRMRWTTSPVPDDGELFFTLSSLPTGAHDVDGSTGFIDFDAAQVVDGRANVGYAARGDETATDTSTRARNGIARPTEDVVYWRGMSTGAPVLMDPDWVTSAPYVPGDRVLYGGNVYVCTVAYNGATAPNAAPAYWSLVGTVASQERLLISNVYARALGAGAYGYRFNVTLQPRTDADNLDAIEDITLEFFSNAGGTAVETISDRMPSRKYHDPGSPSSAENASSRTVDFVSPADYRAGGTYFRNGFVRVSLANALGRASRDYGAAPDSQADWAGGATIPDAGSPPAPSGDAGGGGQCPDPATPILLPGGRTKPAGDLVPGDMVWTLPEDGGPWGAFSVSHVSRSRSHRVRLVVRDGRELLVSPLHRVAVPGGWAHTVDLAAERMLADGGVVDRVEEADEGEVVRITVEGAHTYVAAGVLSHNLKKLPP